MLWYVKTQGKAPSFPPLLVFSPTNRMLWYVKTQGIAPSLSRRHFINFRLCWCPPLLVFSPTNRVLWYVKTQGTAPCYRKQFSRLCWCFPPLLVFSPTTRVLGMSKLKGQPHATASNFFAAASPCYSKQFFAAAPIYRDGPHAK